VIWKRLFKTASAAERGTLVHLKNMIGRRNVKTKPKDDYNACDDFFMLVLNAHILTAAMEFLGMGSLEDNPNPAIIPDGVHGFNKDLRKEILMNAMSLIVNSYVDLSAMDEKQPKPNDQQKAYACELLSLGLIYSEYSDAIREGDGDRVFRCWKFLLILYKSSGKKNYACEAMAFLARYQFVLSPRLSHQLLWSRFINTHGKPGRNIPCDLHIEHLNRVLKNGVRNLGANKTEKAITRLGRCVDTIDRVLQSFDEEHQVTRSSSYHKAASIDKDLKLLVNELVPVEPFRVIKGRKLKRFNFKSSLMNSVKRDVMTSWMKEKWQALLAGLL